MIRFIHPEDYHQFSLYKCSSAKFINVAFPVSIYQRMEVITQDLNLHIPSANCTQVSYDFASIIKKKIDLLCQNDPVLRFDLQSILISLLIDILLCFHSHSDQFQPAPLWLSKTYEEMQKTENYCLGLVKMIEISGKSQEHLTRMFKKYYGIIPTEYINHLRLKKATKLLKTTNKPILDIIFESGFNNASYFYECFKKETGMSPKAYRNFNQTVIDPNLK